MYAEYMKEKDNLEYLEIKGKGFCTYIEQDLCFYIVDIYVRPKFRKSLVASRLADKVADIAIENEKQFLLGAVEIDSVAEEANTQVLESYGFKFSHYDDSDEINYFIRRL